jgi:hypothetical protein
MGRDTLTNMLRSYYWGRLDKANWTKDDDEKLISDIEKKFLTNAENLI